MASAREPAPPADDGAGVDIGIKTETIQEQGGDSRRTVRKLLGSAAKNADALGAGKQALQMKPTTAERGAEAQRV